MLGGMHPFFDEHSDHGRHRRAAADAVDARSARSVAERADRALGRLQRDVDRLRLATTALWELLRERTDLTEADLAARIEEIDLRDGRKDGRIQPPPSACPDCGRTNKGTRPTCLYCGFELSGGPPI